MRKQQPATSVFHILIRCTRTPNLRARRGIRAQSSILNRLSRKGAGEAREGPALRRNEGGGTNIGRYGLSVVLACRDGAGCSEDGAIAVGAGAGGGTFFTRLGGMSCAATLMFTCDGSTVL